MKYAKEVTDKTSGHEEPHTVLDYLENSLYSDVERVKTYANYETGYSNIDEYNCLMPALYVLGGLAGEGELPLLIEAGASFTQRGDKMPPLTILRSQNEPAH